MTTSDRGAPDGKVDLATAQRLVQAGVRQATHREDKTAAIVAAKVQAATRRSARINVLLGLGVVVAFATVAVSALIVFRSQRAAELLAAEGGLRNQPIAKPAGTVPVKVYSGREIYEKNKSALYVMGYLLGNRIGGCCSAFAIEPSVLATNAHCVSACGARGGTPVVIRNDAGGKVRHKILAMTPHPSYRTNSASADSPDVGLLRVDAKMPYWVTVASDAELRALGAGDDIFVLGFPGRVMDPLSPSATFLSGHVGRTMGFSEEATTPDKAILILHDAVTRGGNSGSPLFNQYGHVIGVHAAHIDEETDVSIDGKKTKVVESSPFRIAMRIDLLRGVRAP